ncbi:uncharacterized protein LOC124371386 [Homalodisca vitripennis]|uniref:uncharacterized protein LOC124371386 n=1 Tax=Homalodisca vitripennis TaxID=197043 RepID=UPI001EE9B6A1|nr:uncharacterized protein LOC124371386 [Homalodisca vitripennis]
MAMISEVLGLKFKATVYHIGDGYFYYKNSTDRNNKFYLRCAVSKLCTARANMPLQPEARLASSLVTSRPHSHPPQPNWLEVNTLRTSILRRCETTSTPFRHIQREESERVDIDVAAELPYHVLSKAMQRARRAANGPVPSTLQEYGEALSQNPRYGQSHRGEDFYRATVVDDNGDVAVIFISENLSARLSADGSHIHLDGTFKVVPSTPPSCQLLTISAIYFDHAFPVASVLMGRKTELLYSRVFDYLREVLSDWHPTVFTCDFEKAVTRALRRAWPESRVAGCWFHSANSMNKKARTLGHVQLLRQNPAARKVYKMCQALPLLPANMIEAGYDHVVNFAQQAGVLQNLAVFLNYVHRVWITGVGVESFSVYKQRRRTNNDMESYHRKLRDTMNTAHPNVWVFYRTINTLTTRLDDRQYSVGEFLEAASHQLDNIHNEVYNVAGDDEDDDEDVVGVDGGRLPPDEEAGGQAAVAVRGRNRGAVARRGRVRRGAVAARGRRRHVMRFPDGGGRAPPAAVVPGAEAVEALPVFAAAVPVPPPGPVVFPAPQALPVVPPIPYFLMVVDGAALQAPVLPPVPVVGQQLVINHCLVCLEHKAAMMVAVPCGHPAVCEDCAPQLEREHRFCIACRAPVELYLRLNNLH